VEGTPRVPPISPKIDSLRVQVLCLQREAATSRSPLNVTLVAPVRGCRCQDVLHAHGREGPASRLGNHFAIGVAGRSKSAAACVGAPIPLRSASLRGAAL
jgi:hypothetical protein